MDTPLAPIHVANHWPFVAKQLNLERWDTARMALEVVAQLQNEHTGAMVPLGRKRLTEGKLTPGQAGAIWRALTELEAMGVLVRCRGAGRRPDDWGFRGDVAHWRSMPWKHSGRVVEHALGDCISRADCAVSARNPGQSVLFPRGRGRFHISASDHLPRPGAPSVDSRGNGERRAATANPRAWTPVDSRVYGEEIPEFRARDNSSEELRTPLTEKQEEVLEIVRKAITDRGDRIWGRYLHRLQSIVLPLNPEQARLIAWKISKIEPGTLVKVILPQIADFTTHRDVKEAGRQEGWSEDALAL